MTKTLTLAAGLLILFAFGWYIDSIARAEILLTVRVIAYSLTAIAVIAVIAFGLIAAERVRTARAARKLADRDADVMALVSETHGVFVREMNPKAVWQPLHLNPNRRINGKEQTPSDSEIAVWQTFAQRQRPLPPLAPVAMLSEPASLPVDLLTALDSVQRCLIVGASDAGKTTLLQWLISRRLSNSRVVVIDPHAYPGKWPNCIVVGTGRNYAEIGRALDALIRLMTKRYGDIGKGLVAEMAHNKLTIVIDEWRAITHNVKGASEAIKALLTESRKAAFSVFVGTHSERVKALGIEGEGDLKDGFAVVRLAIVNGQRTATLDIGNGEIPASLPGPYHGSNYTTPKVIDADDILSLEPEPSKQEQRILDLHAAGESYNEIARQVFGGIGGKQTQAIKEILARFEKN